MKIYILYGVSYGGQGMIQTPDYLIGCYESRTAAEIQRDLYLSAKKYVAFRIEEHLIKS